MKQTVRCLFVMLILACAGIGAARADKAADVTGSLPPVSMGSASGLPVPRFVSLKADRVNLRQGPGTEYPTAWVFKRAGLPVEVMAETALSTSSS